MIFVTVDSCRLHLERLSQILFASFPGSTIYQHASFQNVLHDVLHNKVDAVFLEAETDGANGLDLMKMLHRRKPEIPVFIISKTNDLRKRAEEAGANDYFVHPVTEQQLKEAIQSVKNKENVL